MQWFISTLIIQLRCNRSSFYETLEEPYLLVTDIFKVLNTVQHIVQHIVSDFVLENKLIAVVCLDIGIVRYSLANSFILYFTKKMFAVLPPI